MSPVSLPGAAVSADEIATSPAWLPLDCASPGAVRLVSLDEADYRAASFLDQRILAANPPTAVVASATVATAAAKLVPHAHYIFHIGHVGSTLVSRLVGEVAGIFSVREPAILRALAPQAAGDVIQGTADPHGSTELRGVLSLLARTWRPGQRAIVKATSLVSEMAESILEIDGGASAILMFTPALAYLCCILGGPNSRVESRALAPARFARLRRRLGQEAGVWAGGAAPESEGEQIAMSWLCEMMCLRQAARRFASRVAWVDFDEFLAAPDTAFEAILRALGAIESTSATDIDAILAGPLMRRYSKAPEHAYDAGLRQQVLAAARREHPTEIRRGMAWLEALGARHTAVADVLSGTP